MSDPSESIAKLRSLVNTPVFSGPVDDLSLVRDESGGLHLFLPGVGHGPVISHDEDHMTLDWHADAKSFFPPHWHNFSEDLEVLEGGASMDVAGDGTVDKKELGVGESVSIPKYRAHSCYYKHKTIARITWKPCPKFEVVNP